MLDDRIDFDCDECGGPGPPPKFMIPPPPRPPFMQELLKCRDDEEINSSKYISNSKSSSSNIFYSNGDINLYNSDMCEAIPILDASYHSSPSIQTSAMIAVFTLLLVLVVLISSLFVWKHKRKVQNFLPCKTTARGPHIGAVITGGHSVAYEDPDSNLGHRPLMMRQHPNIEMLSKSIHYPSGYPMTRSPPHLVCNSPGPDPYRSNDNVYEELDQARASDNDSERGQSDEDFAEDELSLPSERNLNKLSPENKNISGPVSTIYHECAGINLPLNGNEQNLLLLSSSSAYNQINNQPLNINSTNRNNSNINNINNTANRLGILSGVFRNTTGRNSKNNSNNINVLLNSRNKCQNHKTLPHNQDELNRLTQSTKLNARQTNSNNLQSEVVIPPTQLTYDDTASRNNLMQLAYNQNKNFPAVINNSTACNTNRLNNFVGQHCFNTLDSEVERRNRINQLHHTPDGNPPVATIFHGPGTETLNYTNSRYPQPYYTTQPNSILNIQRSRTNPRSIDRKRIISSIKADEPNYGYAEPVFHEGLVFNDIRSNNITPKNTAILRQAHPSYALPDYTCAAAINNNDPYRSLINHTPYSLYNNNQQYYFHTPNPQELDQFQHQFCSRDSSFGSDSGYSHQTSSSIGNNRNVCHIDNNNKQIDVRTPTSSNTPTNLSLPSSDSGYTINGPCPLNSIKLPSTQSKNNNNCDKESSNINVPNNGIPFGWARTKVSANSNFNHKKCKDNKLVIPFPLDIISTEKITKHSDKTASERINNGLGKSNKNYEIDCAAAAERNLKIDNQKTNIINHSNNCLTSSPNNNCNNNINNNSLTNVSSDLNENNKNLNNSDSNNSFNSMNNNSNNSNSCKSQS